MNQTKLHRIKSALRESIEIASKATEGPWEFTPDGCPNGGVSCPRIITSGDFSASQAEVSADDGRLIAHARTMTPLACKALLTAIEGLETLAMTTSGEAYNTLSSITSEWPDV